MCSKPGPTVVITLSTDLSAHVDNYGELAEAALKECEGVPDGCRLVVNLGKTRSDPANVIGRAWSDEFIGWHRAGEVEFVGSDLLFLAGVADRYLDHAG